MASRKRSMSYDADIRALHKELDEASCPICMDHPHNAVLLLCSSHEKGCRSYICDTSYRHSNCLDRFKNLRADNGNSPPPSSLFRNQQSSVTATDRNLDLRTRSDWTEDGNLDLDEHASVTTVRLPGGLGDNSIHNEERHLLGDDSIRHDYRHLEIQQGIQETGDLDLLQESVETSNSSESRLSLRCPLCRGSVLGWEVVEEARKYLNLMPRSCSQESCSFFGNYGELRRHARRVHPTVRPADIDPSRQRAWRLLEHQREYDDLVSAIRSAMPGAVVFGDYVIENGDRLSGGRERGSGEVRGPWWPTFFLFQMIGSMDSVAERRASRSRAATRHRRSTGVSSGRRLLWGENLLGLQDDEDEEGDNEDELDLNILSDMDEEASQNQRRRRQLTRSGSDDEQS